MNQETTESQGELTIMSDLRGLVDRCEELRHRLDAVEEDCEDLVEKASSLFPKKEHCSRLLEMTLAFLDRLEYRWELDDEARRLFDKIQFELRVSRNNASEN